MNTKDFDWEKELDTTLWNEFESRDREPFYKPLAVIAFVHQAIQADRTNTRQQLLKAVEEMKKESAFMRDEALMAGGYNQALLDVIELLNASGEGKL